MKMTSGSWRRTTRIADEKLSVSKPTSRCSMAARSSRWRYSTGSSIVTMWQARMWLMWSIIAARRRRLSRAGRAGHEHEAAVLFGEPADHVRKQELLNRRRARAHPSHRETDRRALEVGVHTEPSDSGDAVSEVRLMPGIEDRLHVRRDDLRGQHRCLLGGEPRLVLECAQVAVHPDPWRRTRLYMQVRAVQVGEKLQQAVKIAPVHGGAVYVLGAWISWL